MLCARLEYFDQLQRQRNTHSKRAEFTDVEFRIQIIKDEALSLMKLQMILIFINTYR